MILLKNNNLFMMVDIDFSQLLLEFVEFQVLILVLLGYKLGEEILLLLCGGIFEGGTGDVRITIGVGSPLVEADLF